MKKHSVRIAGHQTSITLEDAFWHELKSAAKEQKISINQIVAAIDAKRDPDTNLSSAIRLYILHRAKHSNPPNPQEDH